MTFYSIMLDDYDVDSFTAPIQAGTLNINCKFSWPTEVQQQYDMQKVLLDKHFQSMPFITADDLNNPFHRNYEESIVQGWEDFVNAWESDAPFMEIAQTSIWPSVLKEELSGLRLDRSDYGLYTNAKLLLMALAGVREYMASLEEMLVWSLSTEVGGVYRSTCVMPNVWQYFDYTDYRMYFETTKTKIGRSDLGQTKLYIAIGGGDLGTID